MPTVTYRTPTGQTMTSDLQDAPPQIQSLYNTNYAQVQSQTQTAQSGVTSAAAGATEAGISAQQTQAPQQLRTDLQNKMTLGDALKKYVPLKMTPDAIFSEYLSGNTYGPNNTPKIPVENPTQLQGMGVTTAALGKIGDPGSFMDKFNAKNAIDELRAAKDYFAQTKASDIAGNATGFNANSKAYENARLIAGEHLSSLIPGASGAQATGNTLLNMLPSSTDIKSYTPEMIDKAFGSVEKMLMASKGYGYDTLGLNQSSSLADIQAKQPKSGGNLLSTILGNANKDISGQAQGLKTNPLLTDILNPDAVKASVEASNPLNQILGIGKQYADIATNPLEALKEHPVNTALAVLGPLLGLKAGFKPGEVTGAEAGAATAETASNLPKVPSNLSIKLSPQKAMDTGGTFKDNAIKVADANGGVNFDNVAKTVQSKIPNLIKSFTGVTTKDIPALLKEVTDSFKGMSSASDAKTIYNTIPDSYTSTGIAKQDLNSAINLIKKQAISDEIESSAPGAGWDKGKEIQAKAYQGPKTTTGKIVKSLPLNAVKMGLQGAGLGVLTHFLNP